MARPARAVALVGLRGAGKTTVGRRLARRWGGAFRDLDAELARLAAEERPESGRAVPASAGELLAALGEPRFRELELRALERVVGELRAGDVLATGGGVVETPAARRLLARELACVWLRVSARTAGERIARDPEPRPALRGGDARTELAELERARAGLYAEVAAAEVDAEPDVDEVARAVERALSAAG